MWRLTKRALSPIMVLSKPLPTRILDGKHGICALTIALTTIRSNAAPLDHGTP